MVVNSGRILVRPALENIKLVNCEDRVIVTVVQGESRETDVFKEDKTLRIF